VSQWKAVAFFTGFDPSSFSMIYGYSFVTILAGVVLFMIVTKFPD
jgi:hypothetical protein